MSQSIMKNTIFKFLLSVFNIIVPILVGPYINGLLDKEQFGVYNNATSILTFFMVFATFGIYNFGVREISKVRDDKQKLSALFTNLFLFGVITNLVVSAVYVLYVLFAVESSKQLIFMVMVVQILANTFMVEWINEAVENFAFITKKTMIIRIISTVLLFFVVTKPNDAVNYAILMSLTIAANNIASYIYIKRYIKFDFSQLHLAQYIKPLSLLLVISNAGILYVQLDKILLGKFVSEIAVTEYTLPANLINMVVIVLTSLITVSIPRLNYYVSQGKTDEYLSLLDKSSRSYLMLLFPGCVGLFCLGYEVMMLYGTAKYIDSYVVLQLFALRFIFISFSTIVTNQIMYVYKKEKQIVKILLLGGVLNVIMKAALIAMSMFSPATAVVTTTIAEVIVLLIMYRYIKKILGLNINLFGNRYLKYLYISFPFIVIVGLVKTLNLGALLTCLVAVPICGAYYFAALLLMKDEMLFYFIDIIKKRIKK